MPQIEEFPAIEEFPTEDELRASLGGEGTPIPRSPEELAMQNFAARGGRSAGDVRPPGSGIIPEFRAPAGASLPVKVGAGILNTAGSVGNFFLSPEGVATMLAPEIVGPKIAAPVAKALFGGLMAKSAGEMAGKASVTGDAQDVTEAALAGLGAGLAGLHGSLPPKPEGFIGPIATGESLPMPRGSPPWRRPAFQLPDVPKFEETKPVEPEAPPVVTQGAPPANDPIVFAAMKGKSGKIYTGSLHPLIEESMPEPAVERGFQTKSGKFIPESEAQGLSTAGIDVPLRGDLSADEIQDPHRRLAYAKKELAAATNENEKIALRKLIAETEKEQSPQPAPTEAPPPVVEARPPEPAISEAAAVGKGKEGVVELRPGARGPWLGRSIDDSFSEAQKGYPKAKEALKGWGDDDLAQERAEMVKASLNPMFGHNAKKVLKLIEDEIAARKPSEAPQPSTPPPPIYKSIEGAKVGEPPPVPLAPEGVPSPAAQVNFRNASVKLTKAGLNYIIGEPRDSDMFKSMSKKKLKVVQDYWTAADELEASKHRTPTTPPPAAAKVQTEVAKVAATEGQRSAKEVKKELLKRVEESMKGTPEKSEYVEGKHGFVNINIPGDGRFRVPANREALGNMYNAVKRISTTRGTPEEAPEISKGKVHASELADAAKKIYGEPRNAIKHLEAQLKSDQELEPATRTATELAIENLRSELPENILEDQIKDWTTKVSDAEQDVLKYEAEVEKLRNKSKGRRLTTKQQIDLKQMMDAANRGRERLTDFRKNLSRMHDELAKLQDSLKAEPTPAPPAATGEGMPPGPGAQTAGTDQPPGAQIEQLSQAFRQITAEKTPFLQKVKEAFDLGKKRELSQNLIARTLSALKTSGDYLIQTWQGQRQLDPILRAKGELSAELETRGWRLRQAMKDMKRAVPSKAVREAISKYVDAGGDVEKLRQSAESVPAGRRAPYIRAMQLTPDEKIIAGHIRSFFDARLQEAIDAGVLSHGVEDYLHRIYPKDTTWRRGVINAVQNALLDTRTPGLAKQRVFQLDAEAERAGHLPVNDFIPRIIDYEASLSKVIASRAAVKRFTEIKMPDGRPMLDVSGIGVPIENSEGIREATLIKPSFRPGEKQLDDNGKPTKNYRLDYQSRDYPALKKWKWATNDAEGKPIFVQGDVFVHPDAVHRVDALLEPSKVKRYAAARAALTVGSVFKQTMLDFSGFHQVQIAIHGLEHKVNPFRLVKDVDTNNPDIQGLLKGGMTLGGQHVGGIYEEGLAGRSLSRQIPGLGELTQSYHDWLFQDFIPRVKTTMAIHALERNKARFAKELASGQMKPEALYHQTAKEANAAFGEQNYIMLERSKTAQDMARLILLAPDFLESRARFALQAGTRLGGEQRMALLLGALTLYTTARIMNKAINDEWHFEPENMFSVIYNGKSYSVRTVQGDILHLMESPVRFWMHRLNPTITRPLFELMTQRDEFGRKRSFWQVLGDTISNVVPISMRNSREQSIWTSMLNAFGGSVRRDSDVGRVYQEAAKWKEKNGVRAEPGEFIYDSSKDVYRPLKLALLDGNTEGAAKEYQKLIASKVVTPSQAIRHFQSYANAPFSGSKANEQRFVQSLTKDQRHAYEGAKQEKQRVLREFLKARQLVPGSQGTIPSFVPTVQQR